MITPEQIVANGQNIMEGASQKEEENHTHKRQNDEPVISFYYCKYCGYFKTSF